MPCLRDLLLRAILGLVPLAACAPAAGQDVVAKVPGAQCYRLEYEPGKAARLAESYAEYVALAPDGDVRSGMGPGRSREFWGMFLLDASWTRRADTLALSFSNGFSGVSYRLAPDASGTLRGEVAFLYDVVDQRPPPSPVAAHPVPCDEAHLQSPLPDSRRKAERRLAERLQEIEAAEEARLGGQASLLAGTYRFTLRVEGLQPLIVFGRTDRYPSGAEWGLDDTHRYGPTDTLGTQRAQGYRLRIAVSRSEAALPKAFEDQDENRGGAALAYFLVSERPAVETADSARWRGNTDVLMATTRMSIDPAERRLLLRACEAVSDVWYNGKRGRTDGWFTAAGVSGGHLEMTVVRGGRIVLSLQGTRISGETLAEAHPEPR
jgi:hypothetical protein